MKKKQKEKGIDSGFFIILNIVLLVVAGIIGRSFEKAILTYFVFLLFVISMQLSIIMDKIKGKGR